MKIKVSQTSVDPERTKTFVGEAKKTRHCNVTKVWTCPKNPIHIERIYCFCAPSTVDNCTYMSWLTYSIKPSMQLQKYCKMEYWGDPVFQFTFVSRGIRIRRRTRKQYVKCTTTSSSSASHWAEQIEIATVFTAEAHALRLVFCIISHHTKLLVVVVETSRSVLTWQHRCIFFILT